MENEVLFQLMDGIANAVSDSCTPQIIPDIEPQTIEGKTVIVISVEAGKNRPYYLKSKGKRMERISVLRVHPDRLSRRK